MEAGQLGGVGLFVRRLVEMVQKLKTEAAPILPLLMVGLSVLEVKLNQIIAKL